MSGVFLHHDDFLTSMFKKKVKEALDEEIAETEDGATKNVAKAIRGLFFSDYDDLNKHY